MGAIPTRQLVVPAGSNRSGGGGNEVAGAFDAKGRLAAPRAGRPQRVVNAEQAPKAVMWEPTRHSSGEGRRRWAPEEVRHPPHERHGPAVPPGYWRQHARRGDPRQHGKSQSVRGSGPQPDAREGQAGPAGMADGLVVPAKPGNAGGGKLQLTTAFSQWVRVPPQHESSWLRSHIRPRPGVTRAGKART